MGSILETIKKMLGIDHDYDAFDPELVVFINSGMMQLAQAGIGPPEGYQITGFDETWEDFLGDRALEFSAAKDWLYMYARKLFDPPANSFVMTSMTELMEEILSRLKTQAECGITE